MRRDGARVAARAAIAGCALGWLSLAMWSAAAVRAAAAAEPSGPSPFRQASLRAGGQAPPRDRPEVAAGRRAYAVHKCGTCHMVAGQGNIRFKLDGVGARLPVRDLERWLTDTAAMERALPRMPAVRMSEWLKTHKKISDVDRAALVAYLASLK